MMPRYLALYLVLAVLVASPALVNAQVTPLDCADQISGTVVDFEQPASNVNEVLGNFDLQSSPDQLITTLVSWVVGNACAPIANQAGFGDGFTVSTTGDPWGKIGVSALGTILGQDRLFTMTIFDQNGTALASTTQVFVPGSSQQEYNDGVVFLGFESTEPIYAFQIIADNPNVAWDSIHFEPVCTVGCAPEFIRGDADGDGDFNGLTDGVFVLVFQFIPGSPPPPCLDAADFDDNGSVNGLVDGLGILNFQFSGGPPPADPFPACGADSGSDALDCAEYFACP